MEVEPPSPRDQVEPGHEKKRLRSGVQDLSLSAFICVENQD
jgi:hypothetical protein